MRIVLITQNEPFYLAENIRYVIKNLDEQDSIVACVLFEASPFGKRMSFFGRAVETYKIFGLRFSLHYGSLFLQNKIFKTPSVEQVLEQFRVPRVNLKNSINHPDSLGLIREFNPDLLISIAGNQIFKTGIINLAPKGCLNLHTALLPKYRGLMPTFWVLKNNEKETGVSVFFVDEGIDSGPIIVQKRVEIGNKSQQQLIVETKKIGMDAILEAIKKIREGRYELIPNEDSKKSYYSFPTADDVKVFKKQGKKFF